MSDESLATFVLFVSCNLFAALTHFHFITHSTTIDGLDREQHYGGH